MSKNEEIQAYHAFIQSLPEASYIRPWLAEVAVEVESLIWSDIIPDLSPRKAQLAALELRQKSLAEAKKIIADAEAEAQRTKEIARTQVKAIRDGARIALQGFIEKI